MTTANLCSALEPLTLPLSPFAGAPLRHLTSVEGDNVSRNSPPGRCVNRPGETPPTSNSNRCAVEFGDREPVEILPRVVIALISQQTDRRGLPELQSPLVVRTPMNSRQIASKTDIRSKLVDFAVDRDLVRIRAGIGDQSAPVFARLDDGTFLESVKLNVPVESSLEDRGARSGHRGMTLRVRGMLRGSFRKRLGKKKRPKSAKYGCQCRRVQDVHIKGIRRLSGYRHVHQAPIGFGSQGTVDEPFGVPHGFAGTLLGLAEQAQEMRHAECGKTALRAIFRIGVAPVKRRVMRKQPNPRIVERYQKAGIRVGVNVEREVSAGTGVAREVSEAVRVE